jgi:hypothetical protein
MASSGAYLCLVPRVGWNCGIARSKERIGALSEAWNRNKYVDQMYLQGNTYNARTRIFGAALQDLDDGSEHGQQCGADICYRTGFVFDAAARLAS